MGIRKAIADKYRWSSNPKMTREERRHWRLDLPIGFLLGTFVLPVAMSGNAPAQPETYYCGVAIAHSGDGGESMAERALGYIGAANQIKPHEVGIDINNQLFDGTVPLSAGAQVCIDKSKVNVTSISPPNSGLTEGGYIVDSISGEFKKIDQTPTPQN